VVAVDGFVVLCMVVGGKAARHAQDGNAGPATAEHHTVVAARVVDGQQVLGPGVAYPALAAHFVAGPSNPTTGTHRTASMAPLRISRAHSQQMPSRFVGSSGHEHSSHSRGSTATPGRALSISVACCPAGRA